MKFKIYPTLFFLLKTLQIQAQFEDKQLYKHAIGIDIGRPIKQNLAYGYFSPEISYRHYITRYWMLQNSTGINYSKNYRTENNYTNIFGLYNRIGLHYVLYRNFSFFNFKPKDRKEIATIGVNFLTAYLQHKAMVEYNGALLTPYSEYMEQKIGLGGIELEWSPILLRVGNFQINLNFRYGIFSTNKPLKYPKRFKPLTGTGLSDINTNEYGNIFGVNAFYRFNTK